MILGTYFALQDLGESDNISSDVNLLAAPGSYPDNSNNSFDPTIIEEC
ncbi:MAG: hypothetical protein CM15mP129_01870 [Chloroflexota bacterium]|nr:MAG: hypothetical protein CM15mP129_01870 [Chloroflexota bacterium]